ncbi:hypothetical protein OE88DRAFT_1533178 [Heliocybe sulcata]|uniref:Uncharacterized protein n=1 Tax=Heliocybe sulcata TaxID=5364 RepID=A0A5C3N4G8_9AGAM|nr:hypothetical protein OE88DRAFT_1533178 [Heliocybe sulcata]
MVPEDERGARCGGNSFCACTASAFAELRLMGGNASCFVLEAGWVLLKVIARELCRRAKPKDYRIALTSAILVG